MSQQPHQQTRNKKQETYLAAVAHDVEKLYRKKLRYMISKPVIAHIQNVYATCDLSHLKRGASINFKTFFRIISGLSKMRGQSQITYTTI